LVGDEDVVAFLWFLVLFLFSTSFFSGYDASRAFFPFFFFSYFYLYFHGISCAEIIGALELEARFLLLLRLIRTC
jgi:hypothetical protein